MESEERWWTLPEGAVHRLAEAGNNWTALEPQAQELAALWTLEADVHNGGMLQFYCNWGDRACGFALRGLEAMGDATSHALLSELQSMMKSAYERTQAQGEKVIEYWVLPAHLEASEHERITALGRLFCEASCASRRAHLGVAHFGPEVDRGVRRF